MTDLIDDADLRFEAIGHPPGGQHVGTRPGVVVTHIPTGIRVEMEVGRSQRQNRAIAVDAILGALTSPHFR